MNPSAATLPTGPMTQSPAVMSDIHDIKPLEIIRLGPDWWVVLLIGIAVVILIGAAIAAWLYWKKRSSTVSRIPPVPPHELALELLSRLEQASLGNEDGKRFYFELSYILRSYLSGRFSMDALEMTTEELVPKIDGALFAQGQRAELAAFLYRSDPIKFADRMAIPAQMQKDLSLVRDFVQQTIEESRDV